MAKITITLDGETTTHIAGGNPEYATVCGQALDGDEYSGTKQPTPRGTRIDCGVCRLIWIACRDELRSGFADPI